jgi:catechol 2,3-dioxygenase-like lactoylglutathione lyase family enzyme
MDFRLELVILPVADTDRAKAFYEGLGWNVDHDHVISDDLRFVQVTPAGSACSIAFGDGITDKEPGSMEGLQVVVDDVEAAKAHLEAAGVDVRGVEDFPWGRFCWFVDPDGNGWAVQQVPSYG